LGAEASGADLSDAGKLCTYLAHASRRCDFQPFIGVYHHVISRPMQYMPLACPSAVPMISAKPETMVTRNLSDTIVDACCSYPSGIPFSLLTAAMFNVRSAAPTVVVVTPSLAPTDHRTARRSPNPRPPGHASLKPAQTVTSAKSNATAPSRSAPHATRPDCSRAMSPSISCTNTTMCKP